jgi:hypothetical protein
MPRRHADTSRRKQLIPKPELGGLLPNALAAAAGLAVIFGLVAYAVAAQRPSEIRARPEGFSIVPSLSRLPDLYPGAPPVALPLRLVNPNSVPVVVTSLRVSVRRSPAGCPSSRNLELIPSSASSKRPLRIRARGSALVPGRRITAPAIRLRNLPVNQDACRHARFPLLFTGSAHG